MRVFQGVTGQAGQPAAYAAGLRALGVEAQAGTIREHKFGYSSDLQIDLTDSTTLSSAFEKLKPLVDRFDVFHFHARSFFSVWPDHAYPSMLDLLMLKERGKKVFFHFRGHEVRSAEKFRELNPYHYVGESGSGFLFDKMPDPMKLLALDFIRGVCDGMFVVDAELQTYAPDAKVVTRVLDEKDWPFIGVRKRPRRPLIVHAPSRRGAKGTHALLQAVEKLHDEGLAFDLKLVEGMPHAEASVIYRSADIVVDQLRIGWYGVLATEAMALGKPTIAYIRDDLWQKHGSSMPIINANPDTIGDVLRDTIKDHRKRVEISEQSREFFLKTHGSNAVCENLLNIYKGTRRKPVDWVTAGRFMDHQRQLAILTGIKKQKKMSLRTLLPEKYSYQQRQAFLVGKYKSEGLLSTLGFVTRRILRGSGRR